MKDKKTKIILDTDMDTDCDDTGAAAVLHALADKNEAEIVATFVSSLFPYSPLCLDAINHYYGRSDLVLGALKREGASIDRGSRYAKEIAEEFPHRFQSPEEVPEALSLYRKVLESADPNSIKIVTIGYASNLRYLLKSEPDEISDLSGRELVAEKISEWVCMGGDFPEQKNPGKFGNFKPDPQAINEAVELWPESVPITFFGVTLGGRIHTGKRLLKETPENNPVRRAYELFLGDKTTRPSWDQGSVLYAVRGLGDRWERHEEGSIYLFENGTMEWHKKPDKNQSYLVEKKDPDKVAEEIEQLMIQPPQNK